MFERKSNRSNIFKAEAFSVVIAMTDSRTPVRMTRNTSANFNYNREVIGPIRMVRINTNKLEIRERSHFVSKCPVVIPRVGFDKRIEMKPRHKKRSCKFAGLSERAKWREFQSRNFLR